jgi:hypothetical protein
VENCEYGNLINRNKGGCICILFQNKQFVFYIFLIIRNSTPKIHFVHNAKWILGSFGCSPWFELFRKLFAFAFQMEKKSGNRRIEGVNNNNNIVKEPLSLPCGHSTSAE